MQFPNCLYKYRALSTQTALRYAEEIITKRRVYFAPASSFNDPFEGQVNISFDATKEHKLKWLSRCAMEAKGVTKSSAHIEAKRMLKNAKSVENILAQLLRKKVREDIGIFSLSEKRDDILMWAHYADGHQGICIEFKPTSNAHREFFNDAMPVVYEEVFPKIKYYTKQSEDGDHTIAAHATKASSWAYEMEWRIFSSGPGIYTIPTGLITGIIMGCAICDEHRDRVLEWAAESSTPISIFQARLKSGEYALEIELLNESLVLEYKNRSNNGMQ